MDFLLFFGGFDGNMCILCAEVIAQEVAFLTRSLVTAGLVVHLSVLRAGAVGQVQDRSLAARAMEGPQWLQVLLGY